MSPPLPPRPPLAPPRWRTPSGHDIPVPESVFQAIGVVQAETRALGVKVDTVAGAVADLAATVAERNASWKDKAVTQIGALALAVIAAVGGGRLVAKDPEPAKVEVVHTPVDPRMAECLPLKPGTVEQAECFGRVQAEIQSGKR